MGFLFGKKYLFSSYAHFKIGSFVVVIILSCMSFLGFPCGSAGKESACNAVDLGLIPGLRRSPGEGKGYPLQYSGLENSMDCIVHGFAKSWTRLSDFKYEFLTYFGY